jgi:drug/metabolite transporter (DMT)-like permease
MLFGLVLGFSGIVVLVWPELAAPRQEGFWFMAGVAALQVASIGWAIGTSYTTRNTVSASPLATSATQMLAAGTMFMVIGTVAGEWGRFTFTPRSFGAWFYLMLVGSVGAYSAYVYALKFLPVTSVALYSYVNPIIAVVLGTLILSEPFSSRTVVASALVFAGVAVVRAAAGRPGQSRQQAA